MSRMVRENVIAQPANLRTHPSVALMLKQGRMNLYGGVYDIETGGIDALGGATRRFAGLAESPIPHPPPRWRSRRATCGRSDEDSPELSGSGR